MSLQGLVGCNIQNIQILYKYIFFKEIRTYFSIGFHQGRSIGKFVGPKQLQIAEKIRSS